MAAESINGVCRLFDVAILNRYDFKAFLFSIQEQKIQAASDKLEPLAWLNPVRSLQETRSSTCDR
jgi:hypothetical protein